MDLGLDGKVAVVTGGTSGIGLATARLLLDEGASVALCGRDRERLAAATAELADKFAPDRVLGASVDVTVAEQVDAFRDSIVDRFGRVDLVVNNAGQARAGNFSTTTDEAWRQELDLKFFSILHPTRAFLPLLEKSAPAAIVCVNALIAAQPEPHLVATAAARAGVLNLAKSLSVELAPKGIRVNSILLGVVDSGQWERRYRAALADNPRLNRNEWLDELARERRIPLGRFGRPEEAARAIVFLGSQLASYTTGSVIDVSGGWARHV